VTNIGKQEKELKRATTGEHLVRRNLKENQVTREKNRDGRGVSIGSFGGSAGDITLTVGANGHLFDVPRKRPLYQNDRPADSKGKKQRVGQKHRTIKLTCEGW